MFKEGRQHYLDPDGEFKLWLSPGAVLAGDQTATPREAYCFRSRRPGLGTFSILCEPVPSPGTSSVEGVSPMVRVTIRF